jgi:hypothetical protein
MFDDAGNAKWCDLVLARPLVPDEPAGPSPQRYGTPAYASPEQIRGESAGDPRANLYALGVMAFELLTGRTPFARPTDGDMLAAHLTEPVPDPRRLVPVSPATTALIERLLTKNPANRFQSAAELLTALRGVRPGVRQPATQRLDLIKNRPAAPTYSLHKQSPVITPPAQARWPLLTLAGALGLLAALVALTWWTPISEPPQPAIASSAAGIQIVVSNGNYHVTAPSYRARLGADGCLHNLFVGDIDLLDDKIGSSRGAYFTSTTRRAIELPQLRAVGANVRATDGQFTATYAFEADGVVVRLQQNSSERPRFTVTTSAAFTTVRDGPQGVPAQLPTTNEWHEVRFETPTGLWLDLHGGGKLYKPWGTKRQMNWTRSLTTGEDARIALRIGHP